MNKSVISDFCKSPNRKKLCDMDIKIREKIIKICYYCIDNNIGNTKLAYTIVRYICNPNIIYRRGNRDRFGIVTKDKGMYLMSSDSKCFQSSMLHSVPKWDNTLFKLISKNKLVEQVPKKIGPRLSLTFRYLGEVQPRIENTQKPNKLWKHEDKISVRYIENIGYSFDYIYNMVKDNLNPDITKMYGKTYLNDDRQVVTYTTNKDLLSYKYGGKSVKVISMTECMNKVLDRVQKISGIKYNWVHIVYYPTGDTKLEWHSDDEKGIAKKSIIAGISLFKNNTDIRSVEFKKQK